MLEYAGKRLLALVPVLVGISLVTFVLMYVVPGDPVLAMVGERYDDATLDRLRHELHLDRPLAVQYTHYVWNAVRGDLGRSFITQRPVLDAIMEAFPKTLLLAGAAMVVAVLLGVVTGVLSALRPNSVLDRLGMLAALAGISVPVFWLALILIWVVAIQLRWLPPSGYGGGAIRYLILPAFALGIRSAAMIARITRAYMIEVLSENYVTTARAKGLAPLVVVGKHALRNVLIPVVTVIGTDFGSYLSGSVLTESIFGWPGLGRFTLEAILKRDFPVIQGSVLFMATAFVLVNLGVDLLYGFLDPRISLSEKEAR